MVVNGCISQSPHNAGLDRSGIIVGVWQPLLMVSYHWRSPESWLAEAKGGGEGGCARTPHCPGLCKASEKRRRGKARGLATRCPQQYQQQQHNSLWSTARWAER